MNSHHPLPSLQAIKLQAKRLRSALAEKGLPISHGRSLEIQANKHGYKNWNAIRAAIGNEEPTSPVAQGQIVNGKYLGQNFKAEVLAIQAYSDTGNFRATFRFDDPVDVVSFDSFSSYRKQVSCFIDRSGKTHEKTSDGNPHLSLNI
ncbi:MAG: glyoxalase superfamily protein [Rhizobiaceae bacterium]